MYKLSKIRIEGLDYLDIENKNGASKLRVCRNQGGRIARLKFDAIDVISEIDASTYIDNFASSILFPFANRIKNGQYVFNGIAYNLDCNKTEEHNAIHGLVFNKTFELERSDLTSDFGTVTLKYEGNDTTKGFPFSYIIRLTYTLNASGISIIVNVTNKSENGFPFTLGWHPYFSTSDLNKSYIDFKSNIKFKIDNQQIISGIATMDEKMPFLLKGVQLDDGYQLKSNAIEFLSPEYRMIIASSSKENFLQLYTPKQSNSIAIEPMTGVCDSFNNGIGLQVLEPKENFKIEWKVDIKSKKSDL